MSSGVNITAINTSTREGWWTAFGTIGEVEMVSVEGLVANVIVRAGRGWVRRLSIFDHGGYTVGTAFLDFGSDEVSKWTFATFEPTLARLGPYFHPESLVHLGHCEAGKDKALLYLFAKTLGTNVIGGAGETSGTLDVNFGEYVGMTPAGRWVSFHAYTPKGWDSGWEVYSRYLAP